MENNNEIFEKLYIAHQEKFGHKSEKKYFSPSRINIIGEHIDYNGGKVMPCAIDIGTYGVVSCREDGVYGMQSLNMDRTGQYQSHQLDFAKSKNWMNYPLGMIRCFKEKGYTVPGFNMTIYGNIPSGAGLSSSASVEMLVGKIINDMLGEPFTMEEIALMGQWVENQHIGLMTGIMDQFAIAKGKKDHAMILNTSNLEHKYVSLELGEYTLLIMNTNKPRSLQESKYNERRSQCEKALEVMKKSIQIEHLCEMTVAQWQEVQHLVSDEVLNRRVKHCVTEQARVEAASEAMEKGDLAELGKLLIQSHESLKEDYEVTGVHLDSLVKAAVAQAGVIGARMTGAGFGGCAIALVAKANIREAMDAIKIEYLNDTGLEAEFFMVGTSDGPREE